MKRVHIVLLVLAGALGGAVVMKLAHPARPKAAAPTIAVKGEAEKLPAPELAENSPPEPAAVAPAPVAAPAPPADEETRKARPSAFAAKTLDSAAPAPPPVRNEMRPRKQTVETPAPPIAPVRRAPAVAAIQAPAPPAAASLPPAGPPSTPEPSPVPVPSPARAETENVTPPSAPQSAAPPPHTVTLNAGMLIPVRLVDSLSSDRIQTGDRFSASLDHELVVDGWVIAERGARVEGEVVTADRGTKTKGNAALSLEVTAIFTSDNQYVPVQTDAFTKRSEPDHRTDAAKIGGGAALGAIIGAMAGGGKGAAIGAGAGGGAGAGDVMLTRQPARLPSETRISFRMRAPVTITERTQ